MLKDILSDKRKLREAAKIVREIAIELVCTVSLAYMLLFFCDMGNQTIQTFRENFAVRALFMLTLFMLLTLRPRLLNWQSLAATLLYLPIGYIYRNRYTGSPDLINTDKVAVWIFWFLILMIIDMALYKKVNPLKLFNNKALAIYGLMTIAMIWCRSGRVYPVVLPLLFMFYLIPLDRNGWKRVVGQVCNGWLLAFFVIMQRSIANLEAAADTAVASGRWYGDFLNIGDFGRFLACTLAVLLYRIYQVYKMNGWWKLLYIVLAGPLLLALWAVLKCSTVTMYIGIFLMLVMCFIILAGKCTGKDSARRAVRVVAVVAVISVLGFGVLYGISRTDRTFWEPVLESTNPLVKPLDQVVRRAYKMFQGKMEYYDEYPFEIGSLLNRLDLFTSRRLSICSVFLEQTNFWGHSTFGIQVGDYFATNAHNAYVQMAFEYGYVSGALFILWICYTTFRSAAKYVKKKWPELLLTCMWMAMLVGVLMGEMINFFDFSFVSVLILIYPILINVPDDGERITEDGEI